MKKRPVNLEKSDTNIAEQYTNIYEGLQKDAAQNSWDARVFKKGKDWKLVFRYIHERDILVIEDFGTIGMNPEKWVAYQSLWDTSKTDEDTLGARGQGKFLFHYFSKDKLVLTETIDECGNYRFSYGTSEEWDDETKKLHDFIPGASHLDHQGTKIWIMSIEPEFKDELLDYRLFMKYIASTWWEIIQNYGAAFIVNFDGVDRQVTLSDLPGILKEKHFENEKIKGIGKIRNLVLQYCKEDIPKELRGIAVQRGGMTILRFLVTAEDNIKNRIYGYCNFDNDLEMELKRCEMPNHFGFFNRKVWNHVREHVRKKLDDFLLEITPKKERIEVTSDILQKATKLVNDLIGEYAPELFGGPEKPPPHPPPPTPPSVRIDVFRPNQRKFEYNETLLVQCEIANDTNDEKNLLLCLSIGHVNNTEKDRSRYVIKLPQRSRKKIDIPLIDFDEAKDKAGKYISGAFLYEQSEEIHRKSFTFYLHEEPPVPPPGPERGKTFLSSWGFLKGKKSDGTMQFFAKWKNLPITDKGIIQIVWDYPEFVRLRDLAGSKKAKNREILLYCVRCGIDEALRKLLELRYVDNTLDPDKIRDIKNLCDEMLYEASVRTV